MVCISLDTLTVETLACTDRPVNHQVALQDGVLDILDAQYDLPMRNASTARLL